MKELIYEVSGVVEAPPEAVATAVLDRVGQAAAGCVPVVEASNGNWTAAVQGGWWYRGEYTVEPAPSGSRFTHRVYNVATWMRWGVPLANRFFVGFFLPANFAPDEGKRLAELWHAAVVS